MQSAWSWLKANELDVWENNMSEPKLIEVLRAYPKGPGRGWRLDGFGSAESKKDFNLMVKVERVEDVECVSSYGGLVNHLTGKIMPPCTHSGWICSLHGDEEGFYLVSDCYFEEGK